MNHAGGKMQCGFAKLQGTSALKDECREPKLVVVNGNDLPVSYARILASSYDMFLFFEEKQAEDFLLSLGKNELPELLVVSVGKGSVDDPCRIVKFMERHKRLCGVPFVAVSSHLSDSARAALFERGAKDCIESKASKGELKNRISNVLTDGAKVKILQIEAERQESLAKVRAYKLAKTTSQMVDALLSTIETNDSYTEGHSLRVRDAAVALARAVGYPKERMAFIANAGLLHDIGKLGVEGYILRKPNGLSEEEFCMVRLHPEAGYKILSRIDNFKTEADVALHHHERWDGKGYPGGLEGEDISLEARIVSIADAYDVMRTGRSYQKPMTTSEIASEIERCAGTQFDPHLAVIFAEMVRQGLLSSDSKEVEPWAPNGE